MTLVELQSLTKRLGMPGFAAKQIASWLYEKKVASIDDMTNLSLKHRELLKQNYEVGAEAPVDEMRSVDGTVKYLYKVGENHFVESVYIPDDDRATLCVSSQVGCKMNCKFCMTGKQGYTANLTASQIMNQIHSLPERDKLTNVVMMGMGEPLDNFDNVMRFLELVTCENGLNISMRNISLSTCGIVPGIYKLLDKRLQLTLSISLHAPYDELRSKIMPINRRYSLDELMPACREYAKVTSRRISFEYAMLGGVNDSDECALKLAALLKGMLCHVNLIPVNEVAESPYKPSTPERIERFISILEKKSINVTVRRKLGSDIDASCGQLRLRKIKEQ